MIDKDYKKEFKEPELLNIITQLEIENFELECEIREFQDLFSQGNVTVLKWSYKPGWPITYASSNVIDVLGYSPDELKSGTPSYEELIHPDDFKQVLDELQRRMLSKAPTITFSPYRLKTKDGQFRWISEYSICKYSDEGAQLSSTGYLIDITELQETTKDNHSKSKLLEDLIINSQSGILLENEYNEVLLSNELFCKIFDLKQSPAELIGIKNINYINLKKFGKFFVNFTDKMLKDRKPVYNELIKLSDGRYIKRDYIPTFNGVEYKGQLWKYRDVTQKVHTEIALQVQSGWQQMLTRITSSYINKPVSEFQESLEQSLAEIGMYANADRVYIIEYDFDKQVANNTFEWCAKGINAEINNIQQVPLLLLEDMVNAHKRGKSFYTANVKDMPECTLKDIVISQSIKSFLTIPMMDNDRCLGLVGFDWVRRLHRFTDMEYDILKDFTQMLLNVWHRKNADEELKESQLELKRYATHLQNVREEEKILLSREMHDELGQTLVAAKFDIGLLKRNLDQLDESEMKDNSLKILEELMDMVDSSINSTRKIMTDLRPEVLDTLGLMEAIQVFIRSFENRYHICCELKNEVGSELNLTPQQSIALYRIMQESFNNITKHSQAEHVIIEIKSYNNKLSLNICDNGIGFEITQKNRIDSYGLLGMKERAFLLDGQLQINTAPGKGTCISLEIPYQVSQQKIKLL